MGIAQWLGGRKTAAVQSGDLRQQLNHLWGELQGPERGALQALKSAHTPEQAAIAWQRAFERGAPHEQKYNLRASNARSVFQRLGDTPGGDIGGGGGSSGSQGSGGGGSTRTIQTTTPGVDNSQARGALVRSFLDDKHADVLDFALQARELKDIAPVTTTKTVAAGAPGATGATPQDRGAKAGGGAASALSWAESKLGAPGSAESGGPNQGKLAGYLNQRFGMSGQPWCAMFTSAAVTKGGAPPEARTASVPEVRRKAQQGQGYVRGFIPPQHARPGDLVLFGGSHIAMVKSVSGGKIHYVGGNQSNTVSEGTTGGGGVTIVRPKYGAR